VHLTASGRSNLAVVAASIFGMDMGEIGRTVIWGGAADRCAWHTSSAHMRGRIQGASAAWALIVGVV